MSGLEKYRKLGLINEEDYWKVLKELDQQVEKEAEQSEQNCIAILNKLGYSF